MDWYPRREMSSRVTSSTLAEAIARLSERPPPEVTTGRLSRLSRSIASMSPAGAGTGSWARTAKGMRTSAQIQAEMAARRRRLRRGISDDLADAWATKLMAHRTGAGGMLSRFTLDWKFTGARRQLHPGGPLRTRVLRGKKE